MRLRDLDPVLLRELRATVRPPAFGRVLTLGPAAICAIVLLAALASSDGWRSAASVGRTLFHTYFVAAFALVALVSAVLGASSVARDGESGMLEAIGLTHLSPVRYLAGKTLALWSVVGALLAATAPAAAVPLLWGGVSPVELATGLSILGVVALLGLAAGVAVAARLSAARWSIVVSVAVVTPLSGLGLLLLQIPADAARSAWAIPVDGPFWFASIPIAGLVPDPIVFALLLPSLTVAIVLSYLTQTALAGLRTAAGPSRGGVERWLAGALALTAIGGAVGRPRLGLEAGLWFGAAVVLGAGALVLVALVTRLGPSDAPDRRSANAVVAPFGLLGALGIAVALLLPHLTATLWGPPPRCSCTGPHVALLLRVAVHAWAFIALIAGVAACARAIAGAQRSVRVPTLSAIGLVGGAGFLAHVAGRGSPSLSHAPLSAQVSPLYAIWCTVNDATPRLLAPAFALLLAGLALLTAAATVERLRRRRTT